MDALIGRVMQAYPCTRSAKEQLAYYEAVHQELAPLARELELANSDLQTQLHAAWCARKLDVRV